MRSPFRALACIALGVTLFGCTTLRLPERYVVADEGWTGAFRLQVGDVVYLTVTVKGKSLFTSGALGNPYPLWSDSERIPLRLAFNTLTAEEANLLMGFLATGLKSPPVAPLSEQDIENARLQLWNALAESLILNRTEEGQPAQLKVRMADVSGEDHGFCYRLQQIGGNIEESLFKNECAGDLRNASDVEIRYIRALNYALSAITEDKTTLESPQYLGGRQVAVSVARVERRGVAMRNKFGQETQWSLADWQSSGICVDQHGKRLYIAAVTLRTERFRSLDVAPSKAAARFDIQVSTVGRKPPVIDGDAPAETLTQNSLKFLTPGDVVQVQWSSKPGSLPPYLSTELALASRDACQP